MMYGYISSEQFPQRLPLPHCDPLTIVGSPVRFDFALQVFNKGLKTIPGLQGEHLGIKCLGTDYISSACIIDVLFFSFEGFLSSFDEPFSIR